MHALILAVLVHACKGGRRCQGMPSAGSPPSAKQFQKLAPHRSSLFLLRARTAMGRAQRTDRSTPWLRHCRTCHLGRAPWLARNFGPGGIPCPHSWGVEGTKEGGFCQPCVHHMAWHAASIRAGGIDCPQGWGSPEKKRECLSALHAAQALACCEHSSRWHSLPSQLRSSGRKRIGSVSPAYVTGSGTLQQ